MLSTTQNPPARRTGSTRVYQVCHCLTAASLLATMILATPSLAAPLSIANPSFEDDSLCNGCLSHTIAGWITSPGGGDGVLDPTATHYPGGVVPDGDQIAYVNLPGNHVNQTLTHVLEADTVYTLTVEVGNRLDEAFAGYAIQLRAGGVVLAEDSSSATPGDGEFDTATVAYTSTAFDAQLGEPLEVFLLAPGVQANFDHVRLDAVALVDECEAIVENRSFEDDLLCVGCVEHQPLAWSATSGGGDGAFRPGAARYPGGVPDGDNVGYVNLSGNYLAQTTSELLTHSTEYVLTVEVGNRLDEAFVGYVIELRADGTTLAQDTTSADPDDGEFDTATLTFATHSLHPSLGAALEIRLAAPGVQANFDSVCLTTRPALFVDGFESGDVSAWDPSNP